MPFLAWRIFTFALGFSVLVCKSFVTAFFCIGPSTCECLLEGGLEELWIKRVNLRASDDPLVIAKSCLFVLKLHYPYLTGLAISPGSVFSRLCALNVGQNWERQGYLVSL